MNLYDVTIIGGGPAGLYSAFYSGMRGMKTKIIEVQPFLGGKVNIYPEKMLWDVGGLPPTPGEKFKENLIEQGLTFSPKVCLNTKVKNVRKEEGIFIIESEAGECHYSKTVIVAVGGGIVSPIKLELEGAAKYEMTNLHYTVTNLERFRDKTVLVSGGGNGAIDWAVELLYTAKEVIVIYRKDNLTAHEAQVQKLKEHGVRIILQSEIKKLVSNPEQTAIQEVVVSSGEGEYSITVDDVLINHGFNREVSLSFDEKVQPEAKNEYAFKGFGQCRTSVPGIFAAGDIIAYDDKVNLLAGTFQDAILAVNSAKTYLDPKADPYAMVSSHNESFTERNQELLAQAYSVK